MLLPRVLLRVGGLICFTAISVACRDGNAPTPEVPPPPVPASQHPQSKPLPPEERETKVVPLDPKNCGATDLTHIDHTYVQVLAHRVGTRSTTEVVLTVLSRATEPADHLQVVSLRFCGDVIDAAAPEGWQVAVEREKGLGGSAADVKWELPPRVVPHVANARRFGGFAVKLRGPWRTGVAHYIGFAQTIGPVRMSPHDCPYPFR